MSDKHRSKYRNKIRNWCSWIAAGKTKDNLRRLQKEYESNHKALVTEVVCEVFNLTEEEFLSGERSKKEPFVPTPAWERLQRQGFAEGAKVPGSTNIRKITR